jgi:hypothetical protein
MFLTYRTSLFEVKSSLNDIARMFEISAMLYIMDEHVFEL